MSIITDLIFGQSKVISKESVGPLIRLESQIISASFNGTTVKFCNAILSLSFGSEADVGRAWQVVGISQINIRHWLFDHTGQRRELLKQLHDIIFLEMVGQSLDIQICEFFTWRHRRSTRSLSLFFRKLDVFCVKFGNN